MVVSSKDPPRGASPALGLLPCRSVRYAAFVSGGCPGCRPRPWDGRSAPRAPCAAHSCGSRPHVVLVLVGGGQVGSLLAVVEVVGHVGVLLAMAASCARRPGSRNLLPKVRCDTGFRFRPVADALRRFGSPRPGTGLAGRAGRLQSRHSSPLSALYPALFPGIARATCAAEYPEGRCEPLGSHGVWINVEPASQPRAVVR